MNTKKGLGIGIFVGLIIAFVFVVSVAIVNVNTEINKEKIEDAQVGLTKMILNSIYGTVGAPPLI